MSNFERNFLIFFSSSLWFTSGAMTLLGLTHRLDFGNWGNPGDYGFIFACGVVAGVLAFLITVIVIGGVQQQCEHR